MADIKQSDYQFNEHQVRTALGRLGQILEEQNQSIEVAVAGGAVALLYFENRVSTRDIDVIFPENERQRELLKKAIHQVGKEMGFKGNLAQSWMNNDGEGIGLKGKPSITIFEEGGLKLSSTPFEEQLALKLCSYRNKNDISDAKEYMKELITGYQDNVDALFDQVYKLKMFGVAIKKSILRERFDLVLKAVTEPSIDNEKNLEYDLAYSAR